MCNISESLIHVLFLRIKMCALFSHLTYICILFPRKVHVNTMHFLKSLLMITPILSLKNHKYKFII